MWFLLIILVAAGLGLSGLPERRARLFVVPVVVAMAVLQALRSGLL